MRRKYSGFHTMCRNGFWWTGKKWITNKESQTYKGSYYSMRIFRKIKKAYSTFLGTPSPCELYVHYYKSGINGKGWILKLECEK